MSTVKLDLPQGYRRRAIALVEDVMHDLRHAFRGVRTQPLFSAAVILTLALGLGANIAIFGVLDRTQRRPPRYLIDPASVHRVFLAGAGRAEYSDDVMYDAYADFARFNRTLTELAGFSYRDMSVGEGLETRDLLVGVVSASFFHFFNAKPVLGRFFTAHEDTLPVGEPVAVLTYEYWQSGYGGRRDIIGTSLRADETVYRVIGVAPPGFDGVADGLAPIAFVPLTGRVVMRPEEWSPSNFAQIQVLVRSRAGIRAADLDSDLTAAYTRNWNTNRKRGFIHAVEVSSTRAIAAPLIRARGPLAPLGTRLMPWIGALALAVVLISCANAANLLLARALRQRREIALRRAIGGTRSRLVRRLFTESLVLATLGTVVGVIGAEIAIAPLRRLFVVTDHSWPNRIGWPIVTDARTALFAGALTLIAAFIIALPTALVPDRDLGEALKPGNRRGGDRNSGAWATLLVVQTALSVIVLMFAGAFAENLRDARAVPQGYDVKHLVYIKPSLRGATLDATRSAALSDRLLSEARGVPGIANAALARTIPFGSAESFDLWVNGVETGDIPNREFYEVQVGSPDYFATMGTRILRGRGVLASDRATAPRIAVVSASLGRRLWRGADPIGKCFRIESDTVPCTTVVGIAEDVAALSPRTLAHGDSTATVSSRPRPEYMFYLPVDQYAADVSIDQHAPDLRRPEVLPLFARAAGRPERYVDALRARLQPLMPVPSAVIIHPFHELVDPSMQVQALGTRISLALGALALLVAAIGLYATVSFAVAQRTQEIGIRIALGARAVNVVLLIVRRGIVATFFGAWIGALIAFVAGLEINERLFDASPPDLLVYAVVAATLVIVAVVGSLVPALRAIRIDPGTAIRTE